MSLRYPAERIVIRCPNWIGDMIAATAAVRGIRASYPQAHIALLLRLYVRPVVDHAPWANEVIEFDRARGLGEFLRVGKLLRAGRYDLAVLLTHSFSSAALVWLGGARRRVGHARNGRALLLTDALPWPGTGPRPDLVPKVEVYASLLRHLGCAGAEEQQPEVFTSAEEEAQCERLLRHHNRDAGRPLLAMVPGAAYGASKLWAPARFAAAADALARAHGMQAALLTGPGEGAIALEIARHMKDTPMTFREGEISFGVLKGMVRRSALMICNDTGPRHLAIAYRVPSVVLMGPTDPRVTASDYPRTIILRQEVACAPCYLRTCPTDHQCMKSITPEMVVSAAGELWSRYGSADQRR